MEFNTRVVATNGANNLNVKVIITNSLILIVDDFLLSIVSDLILLTFLASPSTNLKHHSTLVLKRLVVSLSCPYIKRPQLEI